jgi:predicted DNA-binding transcriptional regulator AlpA
MLSSRRLAPVPTERGLRLHEVAALLGLSVSSVRRLQARPDFPAARRFGPRSVRWVASEVVAFLRGATPTNGGGGRAA